MAGSSCRLDGSRDGKACLTGKQNKTKNYLTEIWNCRVNVQSTIMQKEGGSHRSFFTQVSLLAQQEPVCRLVTSVVTVDGGSVGGGHSDFFGGASDGVPVFSISVITPGLVSEPSHGNTENKHCVVGVEYLKSTLSCVPNGALPSIWASY